MNSMILHEAYFDSLGGGGSPRGSLAEAIAHDFGSVDRWRAEFSAMGKAEGGGSGWVLLSYSPHDKRLVNQWAADHTNAVAGGRPVVALDMYEHAYHMDYGAKAGAYVDAFMEAINWDNAAKLYDRVSREGGSGGADLEIELVADGLYAPLGAGFFRVAAGSSGHADGAQQ